MSYRVSHRFWSVLVLPMWRPWSKDEELRQGFEFRAFDSLVLCWGSLLQHCSLDLASREKAWNKPEVRKLVLHIPATGLNLNTCDVRPWHIWYWVKRLPSKASCVRCSDWPGICRVPCVQGSLSVGFHMNYLVIWGFPGTALLTLVI